MKYESIEDLSVVQRLELNKLIAEGLKHRDAFTTEADVRYFVTDDYLYGLSYEDWRLITTLIDGKLEHILEGDNE